jgi:hypothetical protein
MDFGVTFQTDPPAWRVAELTKQAEQLGLIPFWATDRSDNDFFNRLGRVVFRYP